jgi:putative sterol carrier protein
MRFLYLKSSGPYSYSCFEKAAMCTLRKSICHGRKVRNRIVKVIIDNREEMNLLGLMLGSILENKIQNPGDAKHLSTLKGTAAVTVGKMSIGIAFGQGTVRVTSGIPEKATARVSGQMKEFLDVSVGKNPVVPFLRGRIRISGNPFLLLKMLAIFKAA